jgi:flagellar protein FliT
MHALHMPNSSIDKASGQHIPGSEPGVLAQYKRIAGLSSQMLSEAQACRWSAVADIGQQYQQAVEVLKGLTPLSHEDREARRSLLTQILDNDARIRHLISPELERLNELLGTLKRQQNVLQAYSSPILNQ